MKLEDRRASVLPGDMSGRALPQGGRMGLTGGDRKKKSEVKGSFGDEESLLRSSAEQKCNLGERLAGEVRSPCIPLSH